MQQREQRGQLRHDGVVVVAGIGDQRFRESNALSRNAAVYPGDVFRRSPRDITERAAGLHALIFPAHPAKPQLGASLVVRRVERIHGRRSDGAAAKQRFELEGGAAGIRGIGIKDPRNRKRYGGVDEIMGYKLQQISVARRDTGIFPALD
ncbi:hypothetical protein [Bradyrhizobium erythrophlei]|uniref:hypothetical protein n=1 Tax=Bradyrhizobium erythrophlei TaxID=1437360 RepID=UPI001AECADDC|nr:hypothetical protein [Bradyrhizobium erythrophlei]